MAVSVLTVQQRFALSLAAIRVQRAVDALTLTSNPAQGLFDRADAEVTALQTLLAAMTPNVATVADQSVITVTEFPGTNSVGAVATVAGGVITAAKLPGNRALLRQGVTITAPVTGTGTSGITPAITGGVVTGFTLS